MVHFSYCYYIAHTDTSITSTDASPETDWEKYVYQFLGFTAIATTGTSNTQIVFLTSRTLVAGQAVTIMAGNTTTVRGTVTITAGGTGTTFAITIVTGTGFVSGDAIVVGARIPIYYISAVAGGVYTWRKLTTTDFLGVTGGAAITPSTIGSATCQFNNATAGGFTAMTANRYFPMYLVATNFVSEPVIAILGQGQSSNSTLATALGESAFQYNNLAGLAGLEIQEVVPFYRLTFLYNTTAGFNQNRMRLSDATFINVRVSTSSGAVLGTGSNNDHASLSNREWSVAGHLSNQTSPKLAGFDINGLPVYNDVPIPYFDATIGVGGEYADIAAAQTAGKYRLKAVGNITMSGDTTTTNIIVLDLNGYTMTCGTYQFIGQAGSLYITNGIITTARNVTAASTSVLFANYTNSTLLVQKCTITNTTTTAGNNIAWQGAFNDCIINLANVKDSGFGRASNAFSAILSKITFNGGGTSCEYAVDMAAPTTSDVNSTFNDIYITGIFRPNYPVACMHNYDNIRISVTNAGQIILANGRNVKIVGGSNVLFYDQYNVYNFRLESFKLAGLLLGSTGTRREFINGSFAGSASYAFPASNIMVLINVTFDAAVTIAGNSCVIIGCTFATTLTISSDYCKMTNCTVTGVTTLSSGAEYNDISHNTLTGGLTNSSGNTTNIIHDNI